MSSIPFLSHTEAFDLIRAVGSKRTVLLLGENGSGKTSIQYDLMRDPAFAEYLVLPPIDCTQLSDGSIFIPDVKREQGVSAELPNERLGVGPHNHRGKPDSRPVIVCLDEYGKAKKYVKDMLAPIVYERRIGQWYLPEGSIVWGTSNLDAEGLGDLFEAHTKNRLIVVKMRKPTYAEWKPWALNYGVHESLMATLEELPKVFESFVDYQPGGFKAGSEQEKENPYIFDPRRYQDAYASPRSLAAASDVLHASAAMTDATLLAALSGTVGEALAREILVRHNLGMQLPAFADVVRDPKGTPVPDNPMVQVVQVFQFIVKTTTREEAEAVSVYIARMGAEMQSIFINSIQDAGEVFLKFVTCKQVLGMLEENRKYF